MDLGKTMISIFLGRFLMGFGWGIDGPIIGKIALLRQEGKHYCTSGDLYNFRF